MTANEVAYNGKVEGDVIVAKADAVINWIRKHSMANADGACLLCN